MNDSAIPYSINAEGVRLAVRLTPRASRIGLDGVVIGADGRAALQIRLTAPPVDGAANAALIAFLADTVKLRRADIAIVSGAAARQKLVQLGGDGAAIAGRLAAWIAAGAGKSKRG